MLVNQVGLTDADVWASLDQMEQAITKQAQSITDQINRQNVIRYNPAVHSMADSLRDFMRMNPRIFIGSKTSQDPLEFEDKVHRIFVAMGATDTKKSDLAFYHLKDVAQTR